MSEQAAHAEIKESTMTDGVRLKYRRWNAVAPKASLVCAHGIRSHSAWYLESCEHLAQKGYRVLFPDRRGSGLNKEEKKLYPRCQQWISDTEHFVRVASAELPGKPVHLLGISWGGRLAAGVAARGMVPLKSVILSTPGIVPLKDCPIGTKIKVLLAHILRKDWEFTIPLEYPGLFTDNPDEQNYIEEDAHGLRRVSASFLMESRKLERAARAALIRITIPAMLLLAGRDEIVDNKATERLFQKARAADKVVKRYDNARHTLEFDACKAEYFQDLLNWLDKHS